MAYFTTEQIDEWFDDLKDGVIKPDHLVEDNFGKLSLLHAVLMSEHSHLSKLNRIKSMINLGCDVDKYSGHSTPISMAAQGVANGPNNLPIVKTMLDYHQKGHRSDLNIMESASGSLDEGMFEMIIKSGKVDTNVTQMKGSHILHHLVDVVDFAELISLLWKYAPDTIPNPIHRKGYSPLTKAINEGEKETILAMLENKDAKIFGNVEFPEVIIDFDMVDRYDGDFYEDFPEMVDYASRSGKEYLLPKTIRDLFIF